MTQFCRVGFHCGLGGNHQGIGEYMRRLDEAGIPFCMKSVNNVGLAVEAAQIARASGVPHSIVIRWSNPGVPPGPEVPDYGKDPEEAAQEHWRLVRQSLQAAPEFDEFRNLVWVETFNEPRTERDPGDPNYEDMHPAEWLGWFAHSVGELAIADGIRWAAFGMNAGTPEPDDWKRPGMEQYLRDCAANPESLAVALHEYTFNLEQPMSATVPHLIGRFTYLFKACKELGIAEPVTLITEGGWTYNDMPFDDRAMNDIRWLARLVAQHPAIKGVFLWTLEGPSQLPNKLQRLITLLTQYALQARFVDPPDAFRPLGPSEADEEAVTAPEPEEPEAVPQTISPEARGKPRVQYDRTYVLLPPEADRSWANAVVDATWETAGYTIGKSPDDAGIGDLENRKVIAINPEEWGEGENGSGLQGFFEKHYPGVQYQTLEASTPEELRRRLAR